MTDALSTSTGDDQIGKSPTAVSDPGWINAFLGTLVAPLSTFRAIVEREKGQSQFTGACAAVALVAIMDGLRDLSPNSVGMAGISVPASVIFYLFVWLSAATAIGLVGMAFGKPSYRFGAIVSTMGWSFLPWIFMAPITCLSYGLGSVAALLAIIPALWVFVLQLLALNESYDLKFWQTLCLAVIVPVLVYLAQVSQLFQSMSAVFSMV
jgi:hypothetical protein